MPDWLIQVLVVIGVLGLAGAIWRAHEKRDEERFDALWDQIGRDSKSGMREVVHRTANTVSWVAPELEDLKDQVDRIKERT